MQPPDTEPIMLLFVSTTSWLPTGLGDEPQVSTTVAMATLRPSVRHAAVAQNVFVASKSCSFMPQSPANVSVWIQTMGSLNMCVSCIKLSRLCTGRNSSTWRKYRSNSRFWLKLFVPEEGLAKLNAATINEADRFLSATHLRLLGRGHR